MTTCAQLIAISSLWQEAERLANASERLLREAKDRFVKGEGPNPSELQRAVAEALRKTAEDRRKLVDPTEGTSDRNCP